MISPLEAQTIHITSLKTLNYSTPLIFRSNGLGGVASIINRGMPTGQMQMYWNGIPLNNTVIGYTDISIYKTEDFTSVSQLNHASYGAPGGVIHFNTSRENNLKNGIFIRSSVGSFGQQNQHLSSVFSRNKIQIQLQGGYESATNNFKYQTQLLSGDKETVRQSNAQFKRANTSANLFYDINSKNKLQFFQLWTRLDRNLPNPIGIKGQIAHLLDNVSITGVDYKNIQDKNSFHIKAAFTNSLLEYVQESANILSTTRLQKVFMDTDWKRFFNEKWMISLLARHESNFAESNNFLKRELMNISSLGAQAKYKSSLQNIEFTLLENLFNGQAPKTSFHFSHIMYPVKNRKLAISYALSRDILFPTFNDQFWPSSGNPDLKPQRSLKTEISTNASLFSNEKWQINTELTGYVQKMKDFVLWSPDTLLGGLWSPKNLQEVLSRGFENKTSVHFQKNKWKWDFQSMYSFNKIENQIAANKNDLSVNRQLLYRPMHSLKLHSQFSFKDYYLQINWHYIGNRTTIYADNPRPNREFLPTYHLADIAIGGMYTLQKWRLGWQLDMNNIYKSIYQEVQNYAVPMNHFLFTLKIQYHD